MDMIGSSTCSEQATAVVLENPADLGEQFGFNLRRYERLAVLRRENDVSQKADQRLGHGSFLSGYLIRPFQGRECWVAPIRGRCPRLLNSSAARTKGVDFDCAKLRCNRGNRRSEMKLKRVAQILERLILSLS
jgi:hypothetical protein